MNRLHITLFDSAIGPCGIAWQGNRVRGLHLPEVSPAITRERLAERFPDALDATATDSIQGLIERLQAMLSGRPADFDDISLDFQAVPAFHQRVYGWVRRIPVGQVQTYGEVAAQLGSPGAARAVGQAMARNPFPLIIPCHRVVAASGRLGGFSAGGGVRVKQQLLETEGLRWPDPALSGLQAGLRHLRRADPVLAQLIRQVGPYRLQVNRSHDLFLALAQSIIYQQLHGKAAATIFQRVAALFPATEEGFSAQDIALATDEALRAAGLSRNKLLALRDLSAKVLDGSLPDIHALDSMEDEAIIQQLITVRGIGRWTVEMLLMFRLGRLDVLPVDDFGVRKGFMICHGLEEMPTPKALREYGERWAPYRSLASWYLWRATELPLKP